MSRGVCPERVVACLRRGALVAATLVLASAWLVAACRLPSRPVGEQAVGDGPAVAAPATALPTDPFAAAEPLAGDTDSAAVPVSPAASTVPTPTAERIERVEKAMGTRVTLVAFTTPELDAATVRDSLEAAVGEIRRIEALMSPHRPDSELSRINAAAGGAAVPVGPDTFLVLTKSQWISERSGGTFDVTFASMGPLWRFDHDEPFVRPTQAAIDRSRGWIDYRKVELGPKQQVVRLRDAHTRIGLGGIAKGYAVDRVVALLRSRGMSSFFVQAGGDLYVAGRKPSGEPWQVGIRDPRGPDQAFFARLAVDDHAFSTAGDYERAVVQDGVRYHHIIDPRTGRPADASRSVSIWAPDALTADAIDDAVFILGPAAGLALVESLDDCGAVIVDRNNQVLISSRLEHRVELLHPPTDGI